MIHPDPPPQQQLADIMRDSSGALRQRGGRATVRDIGAAWAGNGPLTTAEAVSTAQQRPRAQQRAAQRTRLAGSLLTRFDLRQVAWKPQHHPAARLVVERQSSTRVGAVRHGPGRSKGKRVAQETVFALQLFRCCFCWPAEVISCIQTQTGLVLPCLARKHCRERCETACQRIAPVGHQRLPGVF